MRPRAQHYIMKVMTRWLQNKWWAWGDELAPYRMVPAQTPKSLNCSFWSWRSSYCYYLTMTNISITCRDSASVPAFWLWFFFWGFLMTSLQVIVPIWHNPFSSRKGQNLKQTVLFQINVIYYFKQLIHGLSIHVEKFKQGNASVWNVWFYISKWY